MNNQKPLYFAVVVLLFVLSSCSQATTVIKHQTTQMSNSTPVPSISDTPANLRVSNTLPSVVPTLDEEQAEGLLSKLLSDNGGCRLPCLWGIIPGKSNYHESKGVLIPLAALSKLYNLDDSSPDMIVTSYTDTDVTISTSLAYEFLDNGIVDNISFVVGAGEENADGFVDIFDSEIYGRRVSIYMLPNILSEQGKPQAVLLSTYKGEERGKNVPGFYVLLFYPDQGLLVSYTTFRQLVDGKVRGCLSDAQVELELTPAGDPDTFAKNISKTKWVNLWPIPTNSVRWKSLDEATSMTLDEFYDKYRQALAPCIDTPEGIWPSLE